jgi:hypothetical protein
VFGSNMPIMSNANRLYVMCLMAAFALIAIAAAGMAAYAQTAPPVQVGNTRITGVPDDWTHHHVVFSDPGSAEDAMRNGRYSQWFSIVNEPRYVMQQLKLGLPARGPAADDVARFQEALRARWQPGEWGFERGKRDKPAIKKDWSMNTGTGKVGAGMYPAKFSYSSTAAGNCSSTNPPDYVVYNTGVAGSGSGTKQANIIAYDNIYSGCSGNVPTVYWSYYTGTGVAATSPVLSEDGTQVAFMESPASGTATLRILKFVSGQGTDFNAPVAPTNSYTNTYWNASGNTAWSTCPSANSCVISVTFQVDTNLDTTSAPFVDYTNDVIYVGDSAGYLHKFNGVFRGTPGECTSSNTTGNCAGTWPAQISTLAVDSPVYDSTSGNIFIAVSGSGGSCKPKSVAASTGFVTASNTLCNYSNPEIPDGPIVDSSAGSVYFFMADENTTGTGDTEAAVVQLSTTTATFLNSAGTVANLGTYSHTVPLYGGSFDKEYFTSASASSPTGHLWVCGNPGGNPTLYAVAINSGAIGTVTPGPVVSATATTCSAVSEFCTNGGANCTSSAGTDYIFVSPQTEPSSGEVSGCSASVGCVISYMVSGTTATLSGAGPFPGGASGMVVDTQNTGTTGDLQLYFGILGSEGCTGKGGAGTGTGGCAIQAPLTAP